MAGYAMIFVSKTREVPGVDPFPCFIAISNLVFIQNLLPFVA